ncbi:MAG: prephenate dehydrogenase/arogenate dehydrogenase family protein [Coriobacteriaceae bacterium]|nr:prephenate dehydrogenase/arogenate dehydrogenase family protein [Coriobacteriaceae bacterium]
MDAQTEPQDTHEVPTVGIVGLGLIGGSFARAYAAAGWRVLAWDTDADTLAIARIDVLSGLLRTADDVASCDLIVLATYPDACLTWLRAHAEDLACATQTAHDNGRSFGPVVIDVAGVKTHVCEEAFALARDHGFAFCGAHPMAGTEFSGFAHARADLFQGAPLVLTPPPLEDARRLDLLDRVHTLVKPCGFGSFSVTTPSEHDRVIAFTSQLAHVVSNAYVKSPTAASHHGFSAGSYRDLTRVAHLNAPMWTELMLANADDLALEIDTIVRNLASVQDALENHDAQRLEELLAEGDRIKRSLDDTPRTR